MPNDFDSFQLLKGIFSFCTEHWVTIEVNGDELRFKFIPLSLAEKINTSNKYDDEPDDKLRNTQIMRDQCYLMLYKAGNTKEELDSLNNALLITIFHAITEYLSNLRLDLEAFCKTHSTKLTKKPGKDRSTKLDPVVNIVVLAKESGLSLEEISRLDDITMLLFMSGMNEISVRESNSYEESHGS